MIRRVSRYPMLAALVALFFGISTALAQIGTCNASNPIPSALSSQLTFNDNSKRYDWSGSESIAFTCSAGQYAGCALCIQNLLEYDPNNNGSYVTYPNANPNPVFNAPGPIKACSSTPTYQYTGTWTGLLSQTFNTPFRVIVSVALWDPVFNECGKYGWER